MTQEEKLQEAKRLYKTANSDQRYVLESLFPELKESEDERIRKAIINIFATHKDYEVYFGVSVEDIRIWLEKQGGKDSQVICPTFTFDDILALQCCMETVKKVQEDKDLYNKLNDLHGRVYDAYHLEKKDEKKPTDKVKPKFNEGDTMRTLKETNDGYTDGMPVVVSIDSKYYHCNNETIPIADQEDYEYPPLNRNQKTTDNVGPKFKIGDWVVYNRNDSSREILYVYDIRDGRYYFNDNIHFSWSVKECDEKCHLWSIKDAKPGDVLVSGEVIFIFYYIKESWLYCYCSAHEDGSFLDLPYDLMNYKYFHEVYPATKEQRVLLFQRMKEAGYEWSEETHELKKIEQNPAWSEEDEKHIDSLLERLEGMCKKGATFTKTRFAISQDMDWLKSLKERIGG